MPALMPALVATLLAACSHGPTATADGAVQQAWVQRSAEHGWQARALTTAAACPALHWDGGQAQMAARSAAATDFPTQVCEATLPAGSQGLRIGDHALPAPREAPRRIVVIGDTGCQLKQSESAFQDCNDPQRWPFAAVARAAAATRPDLVIHLGDLHYRESPCPEGRLGCAGTPWGYGEATWQADFFRPAGPLLLAAPWLFVRGNHESCQRAGQGWFRYFDAWGWRAQAACLAAGLDDDADYTKPFAMDIDADAQLIVFDSAAASAKPYRPADAAFHRYAAALAEVQVLAARRPHSVFLNHHPVLGFTGSARGTPRPGHAGLHSVMLAMHPQRLCADGIDLVLNGHVHLFEALSFDSVHPATLVLGNSGSAAAGYLDETLARAQQPVPGAAVKTLSTHRAFGFATLDRVPGGWHLTEWDRDGKALLACDILGRQMACAPKP